MSESIIVIVGLTLLAGITLSALLSRWWSSRESSASDLTLPAHWPLQARMVVDNIENKVWQSLKSIFHDHMVLVKVPVLRYTKLQSAPILKTPLGPNKEDRAGRLIHRQWLGRLEGVYTTFTVCTLNGRVVGCVDVPGSGKFSKSGSEMKEALLLQCGIAYAVADVLTTADAPKMRELFLGEMPSRPLAHQVTRGGDSNFFSELTSFSRKASAPE